MTSDTLAVVTTSPYQIDLFLREHLRHLASDRPVELFSNLTDPYRDLVVDLPVTHVPISRAPHLSQADIKAIPELQSHFRRRGFRTLVTISPKAGFIGQVAGRLAGIPTRLHIFTGQVWESMTPGPKRSAVMAADRLIGVSATHLAADSPSQAENLLLRGIVSPAKGVTVPHPSGSIRGVDLRVFHEDREARARVRQELGISRDALVFVYLGRISKAKGIAELLTAFSRLRSHWALRPDATEPRLLLVGSQEDDCLVGAPLEGVDIVEFTPEPNAYLAASDVLVLASYREGFGSTIIEAAAAGLPSIGTDIVGVRDAIQPGVTGWLVPRQDSDALYAVMADVVRKPDQVRDRGAAAFARARRDFDATKVSASWGQFINDLDRSK